jgi:hypothetical protein
MSLELVATACISPSTKPKARLGLAWLGLAWLGLAWLACQYRSTRLSFNDLITDNLLMYLDKRKKIKQHDF